MSDMILEGLVTTRNADGSMHLAPMGPRMTADGRSFLLRPFPTSHTFQNLQRERAGVLHITDDVLLLAMAAVNQAPNPATFASQMVSGYVLANACRYLEFTVAELDESQQRMQLHCVVVHQATLREFFGLNRAKHAIVEAAILATRMHMIPRDEVLAEYRKLAVLVEKTGGPAEHEAMQFLSRYVEQFPVKETP